MNAAFRLLAGVALVAALTLTACSTSPPARGSDWSRTFAYPFGEVWTAALRALENEGFTVVDRNRERGRILAEADSDGLELRLRARDELVTVEVLGLGSLDRPVRADRLDAQVTAVLEEIARILRER
jgi:uncharacterized lipoprotein